MDNMEEKYFLTRGKAILFGLILIAILIIFIVFKINNNSNIQEYKAFEDELKTGAVNYMQIKNIYIDEGEELRISKNDILSIYITDNKLKDKCDGYVIVNSEKNIASDVYEIVYRSYIKCSNRYVTSNYSEY